MPGEGEPLPLAKRSGLRPPANPAIDDTLIWRVVDAAPDGIVVADEGGTILFVNARTEILFGYERTELLDLSVEVLVPDRLQIAHRAHRTGYRVAPESRAMGAAVLLFGRRRDGVEFPVEISLSPIHTDEGLRIIAVIRDITERIAAETQSRRIHQVLDATNDGVYIFSAATPRLVYVNQGAVSQVGYERDELLTMTLLHLTPELTGTEFGDLVDGLDRSAGSMLTRTTVLRRRDGLDIPVEIVIQALTIDDGDDTPMVVAIARDITQRMEAEARQRRSERELRILEDRERIARDLHDHVIQRLFAAGMSAQSLHTRITDPALAERAAGIVDTLDATISEIRTTIFGLQQPIGASGGFRHRLIDVIEEQRQHLGVPPHVRFDGALEAVDEELMPEALAILREALSNVARHAHATTVEIDVEAHDQLVIRVVDDGIGVNEGSGSGHGIKNMTERARALGGSLELTPRPGGGTRLECRLPRPAQPS